MPKSDKNATFSPLASPDDKSQIPNEGLRAIIVIVVIFVVVVVGGGSG